MLAHISRLSLAFLFLFINVLAILLVGGLLGARHQSVGAQPLPTSQVDSGIKYVYEYDYSSDLSPEFTNLAEYPHAQKIEQN